MASKISKKRSSGSAVHVQLSGPLSLRKNLLEATLGVAQLSAYYSAYAEVRTRRLNVMQKLAKVMDEFKKKDIELTDIDLPPLPIEFVTKKTPVTSSSISASVLKKREVEDDEVSRLQKEIAALELQIRHL